MAKKKKVSKTKKALKGFWAPEELKLLKTRFPNNPTAEVAAELRRPVDAVKKKASRMGLRKAKKYMKLIGRA